MAVSRHRCHPIRLYHGDYLCAFLACTIVRHFLTVLLSTPIILAISVSGKPMSTAPIKSLYLKPVPDIPESRYCFSSSGVILAVLSRNICLFPR